MSLPYLPICSCNTDPCRLRQIDYTRVPSLASKRRLEEIETTLAEIQAEAQTKGQARAQGSSANLAAANQVGGGAKREPFGELEVDGGDVKRVRLGR